MIKVSVIIPVYKVPLEYLRTCFDSLIVQTMQECEFIVVSDGAPKAECSVCKEFAAKDSRFKYFERMHAGVSATRNYGLNQAQGEYVSFVDSDDFVKPNYLSFFSELEIFPDIIFFNLTLQFQDKIIPKSFVQTAFATDKIEIQNCLLKLFNQNNCDNLGFAVNKFFRKKIIDDNMIRFAENISFMEDHIFTLQFCQFISNIYIFNEELYHYKLSMGGLSHAMYNDEFYHKLSVKFTEVVKNYPSPFKEDLLTQRIHFLYFLSFLSIIKQKGIIKYKDFNVFRKRYLLEKNKNHSCLTLRLIFFFPSIIAYFFFYFYKMVCWLPGLKYEPNIPKNTKLKH